MSLCPTRGDERMSGTPADGPSGADESLRDGEERLRLAVEAASLGTWDYDMLSGVVRQSSRHVEILGLPPGSEVMRVEEWGKCVHPDDLARVREQFLAAAAG